MREWEMADYDTPDALTRLVESQAECERLQATCDELAGALLAAYAQLEDARHQWPGRHTLAGQAMLANSRNALAFYLRVSPEHVQGKARQ